MVSATYVQAGAAALHRRYCDFWLVDGEIELELKAPAPKPEAQVQPAAKRDPRKSKIKKRCLAFIDTNGAAGFSATARCRMVVTAKTAMHPGQSAVSLTSTIQCATSH